MTSWQKKVFRCLLRVPAGRVVTYGGLATALGSGSARAVGQALRNNPYSPRVPCHRVIRADLSIGGFMGGEGAAKIARKRRLLEREGVEFDDRGRLLDSGRLLKKIDLPMTEQSDR